jgi:N-acetylmuramoyl-L-alanine amidase
LIAALLLLGALAAGAPSQITVTGARGEIKVPVRAGGAGGPLVPAAQLVAALGGTMRIHEGWADVTVARQPFRFLVGAPLYVFSSQLQPLASAARLERDTLYLPFQFVSEIIPYFLGERYHYDARAARLEDVSGKTAAAKAARPADRLPNGLRTGHVVTLDPGHGGVDPGNPGTYFPRGVREKDVALQVGLLLREELRERGVGVRMTRTTDTLIDLGDRGGFCTAACDLFVSLHVNSLARRRGYTAVRGFETYFLAEARTEDAARVAKMENEAVRFETGESAGPMTGGLDFILKDLQLNEHLRESARAAELVQKKLRTVHTGQDRGVKQAGFMVLTTARRPAILIEMGYSTNPQDGRYLTSRRSQRTMASAIADAIVEYLKDYERKTGGAEAGGGR